MKFLLRSKPTTVYLDLDPVAMVTGWKFVDENGEPFAEMDVEELAHLCQELDRVCAAEGEGDEESQRIRTIRRTALFDKLAESESFVAAEIALALNAGQQQITKQITALTETVDILRRLTTTEGQHDFACQYIERLRAAICNR